MIKPADLASAPRFFDVIVVGSGVAGLRAAIEAAENGLSVALLAKDSARDSNTDLAQGGVAVALSDEDQVGLHYSDTLAAGDGLCDEAAVSAMVGEGPRYINQLSEWGARFDRDGSRLAFTREAAHSARRILHAHGDSTGREILRALWTKVATLERVVFLPHTYSIDALGDSGSCRGLRLLDEASGSVVSCSSPAVVLATGGMGQIYRETTNPPQATGDGVGLAWRAGALLRNMEFVQFHPTALHVEGSPRFLLSEALRGEGGILKSMGGRRFMPDVDHRAELAPRDVVARAIHEELVRSGADHVLLDMTHLDADFLSRRFPRIYATCLRHGIDLARTPVPVAPAAHYAMGGVATDLWGRTTVPGLYAAGEVACTGVHGANRLASNSLLEGLVFGARAGRAVVEDRDPRASTRAAGEREPPERGAPRASRPAEAVAAVKRVASAHLGIVRDWSGLQEAAGTLERALEAMPALAPGPEAPARRAELEAGNLATAAALVAGCALARRESRGAHYRSDYPRRDDERFGGPSAIQAQSPRPLIEPSTGPEGKESYVMKRRQRP